VKASVHFRLTLPIYGLAVDDLYKVMSVVNFSESKIKPPCFKVAGFTLIEMLIYVAFLVVVLTVIINSFLILVRSQDQVRASRALEHSASLALDRLIREVRLSDGLSLSESEFGIDEGVLTLTRSDGGEVVFSVDGGALTVAIDGGLPVALTHPRVEVERFYLESIETQRSEGVKVELSLQVVYQDGLIEQTFYTTALSRGSYRE